MIRKSLPLCPEIELFLISGENMSRPFSTTETRSIFKHPPYWAFCWASGQAMARHILDNADRFKGKHVLDFGSGSGVLSVAAAMAGAARTLACDTDEDAITAIRVNAELNRQSVDTCLSIDEIPHCIDIIVAADVLYDQDNYSFLRTLPDHAREVFVADSRIKSKVLRGYRKISEITATTIPDLHESDEFNRVAIYCAEPGQTMIMI